MKNAVKFATASAVALVLSVPTFAQDALTGVEGLDDRIDDITDAVNDNIERSDDDERFSTLGVAQGWKGSVALSASQDAGNSSSSDLSLAGRATLGVGDWSHSFGFAAEYLDSDDANATTDLYGTYEGSRYFTPKLYAFGTARGELNEASENRIDAFAGVGLGYRVVNTPNHTWRVQAGPGMRYIKDQADVSTSEAGFIASSRYYYAITDTVSLTNDTDVLGSSTNTVATNDLGVNFKVSNKLTTRVSYRTEHNSDAGDLLKSTDSTFGLAVVMGF